MTAPAGDRARRGRVLLVGTTEIEPRLRAVLTQTPVCVPDLFHAIGEVLTADAARPFVAAIVSASGDAAATRTAPAALKRIDPGLEVYLAEEPQDGESGKREIGPGYDGRIGPDEDAATFARGLGLDVAPPRLVEPADDSGHDDKSRPDAPDAPDGTARSGTRLETAPSGAIDSGPVGIDAPGASSGQEATGEFMPPRHSASRPAKAEAADAETSPPEHATPRRPSETRRTTPTTSMDHAEPSATRAPSGGLGDIDLVNAILHDPAGVRPTALALVADRTGLDGLTLATAAGSGTAVEVPSEHEGGLWLTCTDRRATRGDLEPWAAWLGHWLALDRSHRMHRSMAYHDDLTGAWNRRAFDRFMVETIAEASRRRQPFSVLVFDLDNFKLYNDEFGHAAGDTILRETVALLNSVIRTSDRVCRIGGDEFAVILADFDGPRAPGAPHLESVESMVRRFQTQVSDMRFPKLGIDAPGSLSVSAGLATYPWDAIEAPDLLRIADHRALQSKKRGKDRITFGPDAGGE